MHHFQIHVHTDSLINRADKVLDYLQRVRSGMKAEDIRKGRGNKRAADEMGTLFGHQKKKGNVKRNTCV